MRQSQQMPDIKGMRCLLTMKLRWKKLNVHLLLLVNHIKLRVEAKLCHRKGGDVKMLNVNVKYLTECKTRALPLNTAHAHGADRQSVMLTKRHQTACATPVHI